MESACRLRVHVLIDQDEVEDFIGWTQEGSQGPYVTAFRGSDLKKLWQSGPYGNANGGLQHYHLVGAGKRVLAVDETGACRVLDLATGRELFALKATGKVESVCTAPDAPGSVWMEVADKKNLLVDIGQGTARSSPRPAWCPPDKGFDCTRREASGARCADADDLKLKELAGELLLERDGVRVLLGYKSPGTQWPMIAGFESAPPSPRNAPVQTRGLKPKWQRFLGSGDPSSPGKPSQWAADLYNAKAYVAYEHKPDYWRLACLDAATGQPAWESEIPRVPSDPNSVRVTATRVYVPQWRHVFVFDSRTGKYEGMIGSSFWLEK